MSRQADPGKDPIRALFFKYYGPALTSLLSVTLHQVINGIMLGQYVGKDGVAAVGLFGPVFTILIACVLALMIGGGIFIGKSIGAGDYSYAQDVFRFSTTVILGFGVLVALCAFFLTAPLTTFLVGKDAGSIAQSTYDYMFWGFLWLPLFFVRMIWSNAVNQDKAPKVSRNASMLAVALNIVLDLLLIVVIPLGTAGASIATGISVLASVIYLFVYIRKGKGHLSFQHFKLSLRLKDRKKLFSYGLPSLVSELSFSLGLLLINKSLLPFGALAIAAFGLINHLSFFFIRLFTSAMISVLPIMSFNIGAAAPERVLGILKFSLAFTLVMGLIVSLLGWMIPEALVGIFSGQASEEFRVMSAHALSLYFLLFLACGPNYILGAYLQSIGKSNLSTIINLLKGLVFVILFIVILPGYGQMGLDGIWLSRPLAEICTLIGVAAVTLYKHQTYYRDALLHKK